MRRRPALLVVAAVTSALGCIAVSPAAQVGSAATPELCPPATPVAQPAPPGSLRMGVDPGAAGNPLPSTETAKPVNRRLELRRLEQLRPAHRDLVVRLNRLFWSGGEPLLKKFARAARHYSRRGFQVEVQVRYHPTKAENGDLPAWRSWVRHVVDVLGRNRGLAALTITNEVNFTISPNTSDGTYDRAKDALIRGIDTAHHELRRQGWARRVALGFTFAYRLNPSTDAGLFTYLRSHGGAEFRRALGFVGVDDYPGTVYPPVLVPGSSAGHELAIALATMRTCYLPLAGIRRTTPLWVTENGFGSNPPVHSAAAQAAQLTSMVKAAHRYSATYGVTDYRWFNFRDNASHGSGLFDEDGLLRDDYSRKPAFGAYRQLVKRYERRVSGPRVGAPRSSYRRSPPVNSSAGDTRSTVPE